MKFAFYVSGRASRFRKLLEQDSACVLRDTVVVISDSNENLDLSPVLAERGIEFLCFDYRSLDEKASACSQKLSEILLSAFDRARIDYCFCFGIHILRGELLNAYRHRIINFHPSLLPAYPGMNAIDQAIRGGALVLGNSAHFVQAEVDAGPLIMQSVVSASAFTVGGYEAVLGLQKQMLDQIVCWLRAGRIAVRNNRVEISAVGSSDAAFYPPLE